MFKHLLFVTSLGVLGGFMSSRCEAQVCARVVIQIEQELTLEREGFEARLGVTNGQPTALDQFSVTLNFSDADGKPIKVATDLAPDPLGKFYYRLQTGSAAVTSIASNATAKLTYFIVPSPGAAGQTPEGSIYYVGATVKYKVNGVEQTVEVAPDFIRVRPMPALQLQYFLPGDVYGDDPMTLAVEPIVPFGLGVRVSNHSLFATARKLKIQSGQPEIIDNQQGLLIDFRIIGCQVNSLAAAPSLLVDFGDISPQRSSVGSWIMTSSLSGKFVKFTAEVTHSPELGGDLTSLIPADAISTHRLVGRVVVDLPGRDKVPDFLGADNMAGDYTVIKLYESDSDQVSAPVDYFGPGNGAVTITAEQAKYRLAVNAVSPIMFVICSSPVASDKTVRAIRSDGKQLPPENCWISKHKDNNLQWVYSLNLFDTDKPAGATYLLTLSDAIVANRPPVLNVWGGLNFQVSPGTQLTIRVTATDADGLIPGLGTGELPDGARFTDAKNGSGTFTWIPRAQQLGAYYAQFKATDGTDSDSKTVRITVLTTLAGGFSEWQKRYWPDITDLAIIGPNADPDRDQLNNLLEYALDGDPTNPDESILPEIGTYQESGVSYLTLTYRKRTDDPTLIYEVVASENLFAPLSTWTLQSQVLPIAQDNLPPALSQVRVRDSVPIGSGAIHRYLRLRVTQKDGP